jgi:hypothetical protein
VNCGIVKIIGVLFFANAIDHFRQGSRHLRL